MDKIKLWLLVAAAVAFLAWRLTRGPGKWSGRAEETRQRLADALRERVVAEQAQKEDQAHADLEEKRSGSLAARLAGALERARKSAGAADGGAG